MDLFLAEKNERNFTDARVANCFSKGEYVSNGKFNSAKSRNQEAKTENASSTEIFGDFLNIFSEAALICQLALSGKRGDRYLQLRWIFWPTCQ